jgi:hypothetical protein
MEFFFFLFYIYKGTYPSCSAPQTQAVIISSYDSGQHQKTKMESSVTIQEHHVILKRKGTGNADWQSCRGWKKGVWISYMNVGQTKKVYITG